MSQDRRPPKLAYTARGGGDKSLFNHSKPKATGMYEGSFFNVRLQIYIALRKKLPSFIFAVTHQVKFVCISEYSEYFHQLNCHNKHSLQFSGFFLCVVKMHAEVETAQQPV